MNPMLDRVDLSRGQGLLSRLPNSYFAILKSARLEQEDGNGIACKFEVPGVGMRTTSASSSNEAIRLALVEIASMLTSLPFTYSADPMTAIVRSPGEAVLTSDTTVDRFHSKTRQFTVGVTMPMRLKDHLASLADSQGTSFAEASRRFAVFGFEDFVDRSLFVSSKSLFEMLGSEIRRWQSSSSEQVMLRLEPGHAVRIRSAAKEYSKSVSELGALCMAHGLVLQEQLESLEVKVVSYKGAAIRQLLAQVGLGSYAASLLSGVLGGHVRAPRALLKRLAIVFEAPETLLTTLFKRSFDNRVVPAFKAENGKPEVSTSATPWDVAVRSLKLSPEQTKDLLDLGA